jgi:ferredoxin-type protein NapF
MTISHSRRSLLFGRPGQSQSLSAERRPPWTDASFTETCVRCGDCVDACPENILFKSDGGFPVIRFENAECTFCQECVKACNEPVFDLSRQAFAWRASIRDNCLALANIHCQSCQDACQYSAIQFAPELGHVPTPQISVDDCIGCGACVAVCPQDAIELAVPGAKETAYA